MSDSEKPKMTSFLDMPELARKALMDSLQTHDLLTLRRLCSTTKKWVAEYLPPLCRYSKQKYSYEYASNLALPDGQRGDTYFVIDGLKTNFESLIQVELRMSAIFITNGESIIGEDEPAIRDVYIPAPALDLCVTRNFPFIKKVFVNHFQANPSASEWKFFSSLPAMDCLDIRTIWITDVPDEKTGVQFPATFKNLKYLRVVQVRLTAEVYKEAPEMRTYHWKLLRFCNNTENITRPMVLHGKGSEIREWVDEQGPPGPYEDEGVIGWLKQIVLERTEKQNKIQDIDMLCVHDDKVIGTAPRKYFTTLITFCGQRNIRLHNVNCHLFHCHNPFDIEFLMKKSKMEQEMLGPNDAIKFTQASLTSLIGMSNFINPQPMIGIKSIYIPSMFKTASVNNLELRHSPGIDRTPYTSPPPEFPKLREVAVSLDIDTIKYRPVLWEHFLSGLLSVPRPKLLYLKVEFKRVRKTLQGIDEGDESGPTLTDQKYLRTSWLTNNFKSLRTLILRAWDAKNIQFVQVWKALTQLEELFIDDCRTLGNVGFIGEDPDDPVFLKLTNLKRFTLVVSNMPKITDRVFKDVFSKMKLEGFCLKSEGPLQNITLEGIEALADENSEFCKSIKIFRNHFSLEGVTAEELQNVQRRFLSYQ